MNLLIAGGVTIDDSLPKFNKPVLTAEIFYRKHAMPYQITWMCVFTQGLVIVMSCYSVIALTDSDEIPGWTHVSSRLHGGSAGICLSSKPCSPAGKPQVTLSDWLTDRPTNQSTYWLTGVTQLTSCKTTNQPTNCLSDWLSNELT